MRATRISSWVSLNVSGKPSEGQLANCWIRAPPLGGDDHVTKRLAVHIRPSLGAECMKSSASGCLRDRTSTRHHLYTAIIFALIILRLLHPSRGITLDAPDTKLSNIH